MADCSRSPSQQNGWYAAVCLCQSQWPQRTRWWWRRWGWTQWCRCRIAQSFSLAGWTSSAAAGSTSSVGLFWWGSWCWAPTWGPGRWWCPRTPQCRLGSLSGWWGRVGLGSFWNLQPSPLFSEHWAPGCSVHTRSPDGRSPTCRRTHPHQRWAQWGWCHPRTWGVWRTGDWRCSCWYTGRRVEGKEHSLEGNRCLWSWNPRHASPASHVASCRTGSQWSTCRWSQAHSAGRACPEAEPEWWCWRQSWSPQTGSWRRFLRSPGAGGWGEGPC